MGTILLVVIVLICAYLVLMGWSARDDELARREKKLVDEAFQEGREFGLEERAQDEEVKELEVDKYGHIKPLD